MGGQLRGWKGKMQMDVLKEIELNQTALVWEWGGDQVLLKLSGFIMEGDKNAFQYNGVFFCPM